MRTGKSSSNCLETAAASTRPRRSPGAAHCGRYFADVTRPLHLREGARMSRYYVFELPSNVLESLEPFKYDLGESDSESELEDEPRAPGRANSESESASESESGGESEEDDLYAARGPFSKTSVSTYADAGSDEDMERWQLEHRAHITGSPYVYFSSRTDAVPAGKVLSVYKAWFDKQNLIEQPLAELRGLPPAGFSAVIMLSAGHFAAALIEHRRHHHRTNVSNPFANVIVKESKTFHRYTTRRKQGGAQSASDAARGKANSAGSTIRRANERMLEAEIKELLAAWAPQLAQCHRIFIRAPGRSSKQLICGYADAPIASNDPRLASIPFTTGRPTLNECKGVWLQLTQAAVVDAPAPLPPKPKPAARATRSPSPAPAREQPVPVPAEQQLSLQIVDAIKRSKLPALKALLESEAAGDWDFRLQPPQKYVAFPTPLLYAAHADKHAVVSQLLAWGADPQIRTGSGQALGDVAQPHKRVVDALQVSRKSLGERRWNWDKARVGPPLSAEQIVARDTAEKLRLAEENERAVAEQARQEKAERMERLVNKHGSGKLVGGLYEASRGLSADELKQVERERRARAAEARMANLKK